MTSQRLFDDVTSFSLRHPAHVQLLIRHPALFLDFDRPMRRIHRLKNYKIISSERVGVNNELGILVSPFIFFDTVVIWLRNGGSSKKRISEN